MKNYWLGMKQVKDLDKWSDEASDGDFFEFELGIDENDVVHFLKFVKGNSIHHCMGIYDEDDCIVIDCVCDAPEEWYSEIIA